MVTSADPRFKVKLTGQVHRQLVLGIDGEKTKLYHTDSDHAPTLFRIEGRGQVSDHLTIGATLETALQPNKPTKVNQNN
jgi:hypothetical protein